VKLSGQQADERQRSLHAERACLGAALLDNGLLRGPLAKLAVCDFCLLANRELFALMLELDEDGQPFDHSTIAQSLRKRGLLDAVGGYGYLSDLVDVVVTDESLVGRHVDYVIEFSRHRQIDNLLENFARRNREPGADPDQLLEQLAGTVEALQAGYDVDGNLLPYEPRLSLRRPEILTLSQVEAREVDWLWRPYLANGMLAMLSGDPGAGKTYVALAIAAAITTGSVPYTGEHRERRMCFTSVLKIARSMYCDLDLIPWEVKRTDSLFFAVQSLATASAPSVGECGSPTSGY
jgi:replicative DNA helicase